MRNLSLLRQVCYLSVFLALLFALLEPEPTRSFSFVRALSFWLAHISGGLLLALAAANWLVRRSAWRKCPALLLVALAGLLGSMAFAPLALGIEALYSVAADVGPPDDWLDQWELDGGWRALVAEWLQLLPSYFSAWMLINAVPLVQMAERQQALSNVQAPAVGEAASEELSVASQLSSTTDIAPIPLVITAAPAASETNASWLEQLPPAIGRRLLRIEADLHYLNVYTQAGRAMVLGSLAAVAAELGVSGMRVHRSHWVAIDQVQRVQRNAQGWFCELRDGSRVPISRRRVREVHERLGRDFVAGSNISEMSET